MINLSLIAIFIAFLSFIWSVITYYLTYLRKAKLKVVPPRFLAFSKLEKGAGNVTISMPLVFVNSGARLGIVEDMKIILSHQNKQIIFLWQTELNSIPPSKKGVMAAPFSINGQTSIVKLCGFVADSPKYSFSEGNYTVKLMIMNQGIWKHSMTFRFELTAEDIQSIQRGWMLIHIESIFPIEVYEVKL